MSMTNPDFRAELQRLVEAYDEHGGKWPDDDEQALFQAVEDARAALAQPEPALSPAEALMQAMEGTLPKCRDCCHFRPGPNIGAGQGLCSHDSIGGSNLHGPSDWCRNWSQSEKTITTETP